ncbi:MAG: DUF5050 domain-containing protein [Oscillospiraceae bacterium]|nr:DUF5050 domain-containing protein [Oscillospiraceae bacterium]
MKKKSILFLVIGLVLAAVIAVGVLWFTGAFEEESEEVVAAKKTAAEYEQILKDAPQNEEAHAGLVAAYGEAGDLEKARKAADEGLKFVPSSAQIAGAMVDAYGAAKMYTEAVLFVASLTDKDMAQVLETRLESEGFPGYVAQYGTSGNSINESRVVVDGDTIYYSEPRDGGCLYSMDLEGNNKKKLTESEARFINVLEDRILYCDVSNNYYCCSVSKNGGDPKVVIPLMSMDYIIFDEHIYFANWADQCKIYRANMDGEEVTKICDTGAEDLFQYGPWLYFSARDNESFIYRVRLDGEELRQINSDASMLPNVHNGIVYFINWADEGTLYSINPNNPNESYRRVYDKRIAHINVNGDYLYFADWSAGGKPHRMEIASGEVKQLGEDRAGSLVVTDEWLYYQNADDGNRVYRVKTTGGGRMRVGG